MAASEKGPRYWPRSYAEIEHVKIEFTDWWYCGNCQRLTVAALCGCGDPQITGPYHLVAAKR